MYLSVTSHLQSPPPISSLKTPVISLLCEELNLLMVRGVLIVVVILTDVVAVFGRSTGIVEQK